jgi:hypothetical protein
VKTVLGGVTYPTKKAVHERCRRMQLGQEPLDDAFLRDLLALHPEVEKKTGCGVARFYVGGNEYGGECFWLERTDGTRTDWSFRVCLYPHLSKQASNVIAAMRVLVAPQVIAFRDAAFAGTELCLCAITHRLIARREAHVALVKRFFAARGQQFDDVQITTSIDGMTGRDIIDPELARAWIEFHGEHARLQVTSAMANMQQGRGK